MGDATGAAGRRYPVPGYRAPGWALRPAVTLAAVLVVVAAPLAGAQPATAGAPGTGCVAEVEPNDTPETLSGSTALGAGCLAGNLPAGDQDLAVWEVAPADAAMRWTIELAGLPGTRTVLEVRPVVSDTGVLPIVPGAPALELAVEVGDPQPASWSEALLAPGRYVVGVSAGASPETPEERLGYRVTFTPGEPLPTASDPEPNDDPGTAAPVAGEFEVAGDLAGSWDHHRWTVSPDDAAGAAAWTLEFRLPLGVSGDLTLADASGAPLVRTSAREGLAQLPDLVLAPGEYIVRLEPPASVPTPYLLAARSATTLGGDPEPNDSAAVATRMGGDPAAARGLLGREQDEDWYRFTVTEPMAAETLDVKLIWRSDVSRSVCLEPADEASGVPRVCRESREGIVLAGLSLPVGDHLLRVTGDVNPADPYMLRVDPAGPGAPDIEREPNDSTGSASPLDPTTGVRGRGGAADVDVFRVSVTGAPQLWDVVAEGTAIEALDWIATDESVLGRGDLAADGSGARLADLYLIPGEHWLRVRAGGPYALRLDPLGPPDPDAEREPNGVAGHEERLIVGRTRTGRLPLATDRDVYRFELAGLDHLVLHLDVEPGLELHADLADEVSPGTAFTVTADQPLEQGMLLPPGRYSLTLSTTSPSAGRYRVRLERADPFLLAGEVHALPVRATLTLGEAVAAHWPTGQRVPAVLRIANDASGSLALTTDWWTSDPTWLVDVTPGPVTVEAGEEVELRVDIHVPPMVPADAPVRIAARLRAGDGRSQGAAADVTPSRDALAVTPEMHWLIPTELLGGLDAASLALGATPVVSLDPNGEAGLHDGFATVDSGLSWPTGGAPVTLTVDLAGDEPVPVQGTVLHPLAADATLGEGVRTFDLALSLDGAAWDVVLTGTVERLAREQAFVLAQAVPARYAQLRVTSQQRELPSRIELGEWKVVAQPGWTPPGTSLDLADPLGGGHVVTLTPLPGSQADLDRLLDVDLSPLVLPVKPRSSVSWVVGFLEDRAARVASLEWQDPQPSDPEARLGRVNVFVSTDSPIGPWHEVGTWRLDRAPDGRIAPFQLQDAPFVRFIRFEASTGRRQAGVELPGRLVVDEADQGATYRSILGQWGLGQRIGPLEWTTGTPTIPADDEPEPADGPDSPRPLAFGQAVTGRVERGRDSDWFRVTVPDGQRGLVLTLRGVPRVGTALRVQDAEGRALPTTFGAGDVPGGVDWTVAVEPGMSYLVEGLQPRASVAATFDTSASVVTQLAAIRAGLRGLAVDIRPGEEGLRVLPFDGEPLQPGWPDDPYLVANAVDRYQLGPSSSRVEANLEAASRDLAGREGGRAVLLLTDAASSSFERTPYLWAELAATRPLVVAVEVGGEGEMPARVRHHLMVDWAASTDGIYQHAASGADIEQAFDALATWLRRPASYELVADTRADPPSAPDTGSITVLAPEVDGIRRALVREGAAVALVLDTSGSMLEPFAGERRIDVAKRLLRELVTRDLPAGLPVSLRVFEARRNSCGTALAIPLGPLDPALSASVIDSIEAPATVRTPLAAAIAAVADDLAAVTGPRIVVVVSDGRESCHGHPDKAVSQLRAAGIDVTVNVIGLGLDRASRKSMRRLATVGGGVYLDAADPDGLGRALRAAVSAPFLVLDATGAEVARGAIGGDAVAVPPGSYRVTVPGDPERSFRDVFVSPGTEIVLELPHPSEPDRP